MLAQKYVNLLPEHPHHAGSKIDGMSAQPFTFDPVLLEYPNRMTPPYSWVGHIPFAFFLIKHHQPATLVELGTTSGDSYFAFCQAVRKHELPTRCFAIHTGMSDPHARHENEDGFAAAQTYNEEHYADFSTLMSKTSEAALADFTDGTVDVLHFVNAHAYEPLRAQFKAWLPKMSKQGVILFHNIHETQNDFGVWVLWKELADRYPSIDFPHSHGLGVCLFGRNLRKGKAPFFRHFQLQPDLIQLLDRMTRSYIPQLEPPSAHPPHYARLYLPTEGGTFPENHYLEQPVTPDTEVTCFSLPEKLPARTLRFQPLNVAGIIQLERILLEMEEGHLFPLPLDHVTVPKDIRTQAHTYFFTQSEPIFFVTLQVPFNPLSITFEWHTLSRGDTGPSVIEQWVKDLEQTQSNLSSALQKHQQLAETHQAEQQSWIAERDQMQHKLDHLNQAYSALQTERQELEHLRDAIQQERDQLQVNQEKLEKNLTKSESQRKKLQNQLEDRQAQLKQTQIDLDAARKQIDKDQDMQNLLEEQISHLRQQKEELADSFDNIQNIYQKQLHTLEEGIEYNRTELKLLQEKIIQKEQESRQESEKAYALHQENMRLEKDMTDLRNTFAMRLSLSLTYPFRKINEWLQAEPTAKPLPPPVASPAIPDLRFWANQNGHVLIVVGVGPRTEVSLSVTMQDEADGVVEFTPLLLPQTEDQVFFLEHPAPTIVPTLSGSLFMGDQEKSWGPVPVHSVDQTVVAHCESAKIFQNGVLHIIGWAVSSYPLTQIDLWTGDQQVQQIRLGTKRPDVREDFPNYPDWQLAGFDEQIPLSADNETDRLSLRFVLSSGDTHTLTLNPIHTDRILNIQE